jgi:hypothetical protein
VVRFLLPIVVPGCFGSSDVETDDGLDPPDIAGRYNVIVTGTNGCDGNADLIDGWASGALTISGEAGDLTFDFAGGNVFSGSVDDAYSFQFGGTTAYEAYTLSVFASGVVNTDEMDRHVLQGDFEVTADDDGIVSNDCTITGPFEAYWLSA